MTPKQLHYFEQRLLDEQSELLGVATMVDESAETVTLDQTAVGRLSRIDAMQQQAMAFASQERQGERLRRIKSALERIEDDEYGECLECLAEVPVARLEVDPSIECCVSCAK